jgi:hypothetical protein
VLPHANPRAVARVRELDLVHEGEHERNPPAAFGKAASFGGRGERAVVGHLDVDHSFAALQRHVDDVIFPRLLDRVRQGLRDCELEVEALLRAEAAPLRESVDRASQLARVGRPITQPEVDSRGFVDKPNTPSVPNEVPNSLNGSNS